jgi:pimeloyl-ACP methyl ester carboxylesterase
LPVRAVIFDFNGTLSHDEPILCEIFCELFAEHGRPLSAQEYFDELAGLSDRFRVIAWNAPGYMLTDAFAKDTPDCKDYAAALGDFLGALKLDRVSIVANSFGTRVAQCFAIHHPGRIVRLAMTGVGDTQDNAIKVMLNGQQLGGNMPGRGDGERLAVDPNNSNIIYYGATGDSTTTFGLWKSTNGGSAWSQVSSFTAIGDWQDDPTDPNGYTSQKQGLWWVVFDPRTVVGGVTQNIYIGVATKNAIPVDRFSVKPRSPSGSN